MAEELDLVWLTEGYVERIWYDPPAGGRNPVILIEMICGKRYVRVQLDTDQWVTGPADETWYRSPDAILIAGKAERDA